MYLDKTFSNDLFYGYYGRGYKRLIVTTPSYVMDPTITITATGYTQISNSITVLEGTSVSYTVSAVGYQTVSDTVTVDDNGILEVDMEELMVTLTINPTPSGATVTLTSEGYERSGNTITIQQGKPVSCVVSATGYDDYSFSMILMEDTTISVPLEGYRLTIDPTPTEATVQLSASGFAQSGNLILVSSGTATEYNVSASGYFPESGTVTVTANTTLAVTLTEEATLTVDPTPSGATVTLTSEGYEQSGNTITTQQGKPVSCVVSATDYDDYSFSMILMEDTTISVPLTGYRLTIDPTPAEANVQLTASGYVQSGNLILVSSGTSVTYTVSADGYDTITDTIQVTEDTTKETVLEQDFIQPTLTEDGTPGGSSMAVSCTVDGPNIWDVRGNVYSVFEPNDSYLTIININESTYPSLSLKINIYLPKPTRLTELSFGVISHESGNAINTKLYAGNSMGDTATLIKDIGTVPAGTAAQITIEDSQDYFQYYTLSMSTDFEALMLNHFLLQGKMHDIVS